MLRQMRIQWLLAATGIAALYAQSTKTNKVDFGRQIRPILSDNCFSCHGPDEKKRLAGLRLDDRESAMKVITPGDRASSKLFQRVGHADKAKRMPPPSEDRAPTKEQVELIGKWIDEGAEWKTHWSYVPPKHPPAPDVRNKAWVKNTIDNFVLARLEKEGLKPSPEADRATLLRRVTLDLTGLPPTPKDVREFLADKAPDAYERRVNRLLESKHYGERMAMMWLDLARYADTHGYHIDSHREMWPWRDWVIASFNQNKPYNQFVIDQLAGDMEPNPTREQKIASGFNRNHMINFEGGAIAEEYLAEYIVDRVETTSVAFMGMTMGCARCHDHKYDPISQKDFYRFFAFFNNVDEKGLDGKDGNAKPFLPLPDQIQEARGKELKQAIEAREKLLLAKDVDKWVEDWAKAANPSNGPQDTLAHYELDGNFSDVSGKYRHGRLLSGNPTFGAGPAGQSINFDAESQVDWTVPAKSGTFSVSFWMRSNNKLEQTILHAADDAKEGIRVKLEEAVSIGDLKRGARMMVQIANHWPADGLEVRTRERLVQSENTAVAIIYDGSAKAAGLHVFVNGKPAELDVLQDKLSKSPEPSASWGTGDKKVASPARASLDDLRFYGRTLSDTEAAQLAVDAPVRSTVLMAESKRSKEQKERLKDYFLTTAASEDARKAYAELKLLRKEQDRLEKEVVSTMVMDELPKMRDTFVLARGDYRNHGEKVTPGVPANLPPLPVGAPANRLTLAKWLVEPSHPLTARVAVNRYWQMYFGSGLVETSEDFGSQGAPPTHPELLDWLATEFSSNGWDVKAMQKLIVTSATYRQSSKATPQLVEKDPQNHLLARMSRFRMPAEMVRDNALALSGLLNEEVGGRSVFPYQPAGLWEEMAYGDVFSAQTYVPSKGKDLYRRSMYTFWKRTVPPAQMSVFDAPDREKCLARRARTNTPLQALVLLNDPTYLESARMLAERVILEGGKDKASRIRLAFQTASSRAPVAAEIKALSELADKQMKVYRADASAAGKLLAIGDTHKKAGVDPVELAAWTTVTSVILNLDEVITKE